MPDPASSAAFDRYAYVNNNPINFNDPSGHMRIADEQGGTGIRLLNNNSIAPIIAPQGPNILPTYTPPFIELYSLPSRSGPIIQLPSPSTEVQVKPLTPSLGPYPPDGYETKTVTRMNWGKVNWIDFTTNSAGIVADVATGVGVIFSPALIVAEWGTVIDVSGYLFDAFDYIDDGAKLGLTIDAVEIVEAIINDPKALRIVPVFGFIVNANGVKTAWEAGYEKHEILIPK